VAFESSSRFISYVELNAPCSLLMSHCIIIYVSVCTSCMFLPRIFRLWTLLLNFVSLCGTTVFARFYFVYNIGPSPLSSHILHARMYCTSAQCVRSED
jgi:hypothetical protein